MTLRNAAAGRPDFSKAIYESAVSTLFSPRQMEWSYLWEAKKTEEEDTRLAPFETRKHKVYTAPAGKRLLLKGAMVSAENDAIHCVWIVVSSPGFLGDRFFLRSDSETFVPSEKVGPEHALYIYFTNQSSDILRATVSFIGLEEVLE